MAITSAICSSFKQQVLVEGHNLTNGSDSIKLALYTSSATMGATTTVYSTSQEVSGTNYSAGGSALTNVTPALSGTTAVCDFADLTFGRGKGFVNAGIRWTVVPNVLVEINFNDIKKNSKAEYVNREIKIMYSESF